MGVDMKNGGIQQGAETFEYEGFTVSVDLMFHTGGAPVDFYCHGRRSKAPIVCDAQGKGFANEYIALREARLAAEREIIQVLKDDLIREAPERQ